MSKPLGEKLRMIRGSLTQTELAQMLDCPQGYISRYEKGVVKPSIHFIYNLTKNFNVSLDWLLADEGEMYVAPTEEEKERMDPDIYEVLNVLKANKDLAVTLKGILTKKESLSVLNSIHDLSEIKQRALISLLN